MAIPDPPQPRLLRAVSPPLGAYFRVGRDHLALQALLASDRHNFTGLVYDAHDAEQHDELRRVARERHLETVLDPKAFELGLRPEPVRAGIYLEDFLRPATDLALRAAKVDPLFESARQRLEHWRLALGAIDKSGPPPSFAKTPDSQRTHPSLRRSA